MKQSNEIPKPKETIKKFPAKAYTGIDIKKLIKKLKK